MGCKEFEESVMAADRCLREDCECPWSAVAELQKKKSISQLQLAEFSQALCTVLQVALFDLLKTCETSLLQPSLDIQAERLLPHIAWVH